MNQHAPPAPSLYADDFYAWSQAQARLVAALARLGDRLPEGLDIPNLVEEVESLGRSELASVGSYLFQILVHILKATSEPHSPAVQHWRSEVREFQKQLAMHFSPSMRRQIDLDAVWADALDVASLKLEEYGHALRPDLPSACPFSLQDLTHGRITLEEIERRLSAAG